MLDDLRQALRSIARRPALSALLILILALCIGGNTSVFSAVDSVVLQQLPYKDADRLVVLTGLQISTGEERQSIAWLDFEEWRRRARSFDGMAAFLPWSDRILVGDSSSELVQANYVPASYFSLLGVEAGLGRTFTAAEDVAPECCRVAVISHGLWQRRYGRDPKVIGTKIQLNNAIYEVIGVMPREFRDFPDLARPIELWLPSAMSSEVNATILTDRSLRTWYVLGRLKPGVTLEQARQDMERIGGQLRQEFPLTSEDYGVHVESFREFAFRDLDRSVRILLAGSLLVLLIGCANVGNLLLVRALARRHEMSLRLVMGAGRERLVRQLLFEGLVLAVLGGALGLVVAYWTKGLLASAMQLPPFVEIEIDLSVLLFFCAITLLTGFAFGLPPALRAARVEPRQSLQEGGRSGGARSHWKLNILVISQVAVVAVLLIGAGLLLKSFQKLRSTDLDYNIDRVLLMQLDFGLPKFDERPRIPPVIREMLERVNGMKGVEQAVIWGQGAPGVDNFYTEVTREEATAEERPTRADQHIISPGGLRMMGIPLLRGRDFSQVDTADSPPVALISDSLAKALWPGQEPLGKRLRRRPSDPWYTVVGILADVSLRERQVEREHDLMLVFTQRPVRDLNLLVKATGDPTNLMDEVRQVLGQVEPQLPVRRVVTMAELHREQEATYRFNATMMGLYAALALALAVMGLYAVLSQGVLQRTREIGVRLALGARQKDIFSMVMTHGVGLIVVGLAIGSGVALVLTHLIESLLYDTTTKDPATFIGVAVIFIGTGLLAVLLPALRAIRVEPTTALRQD